MLFKDIVAGRYTAFSRLGEKKRNSFIEAVKYIEMVASTSGIDISDWDCHQIFSTDAACKEIVTHRPSINARLFDHAEKLRSELPPSETSTELSIAVREALANLSRQIIANRISDADIRIRSLLRNANDAYIRMESYVKDAAAERAALSVITGRDNRIEEQVQEINNSSFWRYLRTEDHGIIFVTKNDIICSYKNPAAGIDITVNFGKYKAVYNMNTARISVFIYENNLRVESIYHPHVNSNGGVCWGNASEATTKAMANMDLSQLFGLLASVLVSYTPGIPYVSIENFYRSTQTAKELESQEKTRMKLLEEARQERDRECERETAEERARELLAYPQEIIVVRCSNCNLLPQNCTCIHIDQTDDSDERCSECENLIIDCTCEQDGNND